MKDAADQTPNIQSGSLYYVVRYALNRLDPENDKDSIARKSAAAAVLRRLDPHEAETNGEQSRHRKPRKEDLVLNQYEQMVAMDVVAPEDIPVAFEGISKVPTIARMGLKNARHWWTGRDNRRAQRIGHISPDDATTLCTFVVTPICTFWGTASWTSWLW